jgi:hypothetical protein
MKTYDFSMYVCGCGYETTHAGNSKRHKKGKCGHIVSIEHREYVLKKDTIITEDTVLETERLNKDIKCLNKEINRLNKECEVKDAKISRISRKLAEEDIAEVIDDADKKTKEGLVYYIIDRDIQTRGKIGRTGNTDVKKLRSRYSTFANPMIFTWYSKDIVGDEKRLKDALKEAGCINRDLGLEAIHHSEKSLRIFHEMCIL